MMSFAFTPGWYTCSPWDYWFSELICRHKYDLLFILIRLQESEKGHSVLETVLSQNSNTSSNDTSWYYMNDHDIMEMEVEVKILVTIAVKIT